MTSYRQFTACVHVGETTFTIVTLCRVKLRYVSTLAVRLFYQESLVT